jgi:hypothetical protein
MANFSLDPLYRVRYGSKNAKKMILREGQCCGGFDSRKSNLLLGGAIMRK